MTKRGVKSPDIADALALTYANVIPQADPVAQLFRPSQGAYAVSEYDPLEVGF